MPFSSAISATFAASSRLAFRLSPVKRGPCSPEVVVVEVVGRLEAAGQKAATERRIRHEADPQLATGGEHLALDVAGPQRVLGLQRGDRMDRVRAPDRLRRCLAEAEVPHLALLDELRHRAHRLLDRHVGVDAVLVEEVDVVGAEPLERPFDRAADVVGGAVERTDRRHVAGRRVVHPAGELGRDHVLVAPALDRAADQLLVGQRAVQLRGVEEVDPELQRPLDRRDRLVLVGRAVEGRHAHASEPEGGYLERSELAGFHWGAPILDIG